MGQRVNLEDDLKVGGGREHLHEALPLYVGEVSGNLLHHLGLLVLWKGQGCKEVKNQGGSRNCLPIPSYRAIFGPQSIGFQLIT